MRQFGLFVIYFLIPLFFIKNWPGLFFLTALWFALYVNSLVLIPLAVLLDGYFGNFYSVPILSIIFTLGALLIEISRPRLSNFRFLEL